LLHISKDRQKIIEEHFADELNDALQGRQGFLDKCQRWRKNFEAEPDKEQKNFPWERAPLHKDTEVLTVFGWRKISKLSIGDLVLTRRDSDSVSEWKPVLATPSVFANYLLKISSKSLCQYVTLEHTMVCEDQSGKVIRLPAKELVYQTSNITHTEKVGGKTGLRVKLTSVNTMPEPSNLFGLDSGDVAEFLGWWLAEGWNFVSGTLGLGQKIPENRKRIKKLLERLKSS